MQGIFLLPITKYVGSSTRRITCNLSMQSVVPSQQTHDCPHPSYTFHRQSPTCSSSEIEVCDAEAPNPHSRILDLICAFNYASFLKDWIERPTRGSGLKKPIAATLCQFDYLVALHYRLCRHPHKVTIMGITEPSQLLSALQN